MNIEEPKLVVAQLPCDERGEKVEPEEQPAKIVQDGSVPVGVNGNTTGAMPISIEQHLTAGIAAATIRDPCGGCKHFDRAAWLQHVRAIRGSASGRAMLNNVMAELLVTDNVSVHDLHRSPADGDFDTDHAINSLAVCRVLTESLNDLVAVHPLGVCPAELRSAMRPRGFYTPRDIDTERAGSAAFDAIMRAAQGK